MTQLFPADHLVDAVSVLVIFTPLIVLSLRAAVDPAPAIALLNRVSAGLDLMNPPWMQRSRSGEAVPDTPANRAMVRLLCASLTAAAFYQLAEQLLRMVR